MTKTEQAGTDANQIPGKSSVTAENVSHRTAKNTRPLTEEELRGQTISLEGLKAAHRRNMALFPFEVVREALVEVLDMQIIEEA